MGRKRQDITLKEPVRIRQAERKDGNKSLYLDIYVGGKRKKEGLKLYLVPEITPAAKAQNRNTLKLAEQIKAQRILDIQKVGMLDWEQVKKIHTPLLDYLDKYIADTEGLSASSARAKRNLRTKVAEYLSNIAKEELPVEKVDKDFIKGFIAYLKTCTYNQGKKALTSTTQRMFINRLGSVLELALREGLLQQNPIKLLDKKEKPQKRNAEKEFLTIDELRRIMATECRYLIVKKAFLFACFTGLRYSDVISLRWSEIHHSPDDKTLYIEKRQVKTKNHVVVPLSNEALKWMPQKQEGEDKIFHELTITSTTVEVLLLEWMHAAGIAKHITFHCSLHTAATLWLTLGSDLYTVSKLLGHRSIKVTEVYAKIVDQSKINTMNLVNQMFETGHN